MACSIHEATAASDVRRQLRIPRLLWHRLLRDLRARGELRGESGAFVLGNREGSIDRARSYVPYDELDPHAIESGIIRFSSEGYSHLWNVCRVRGQRVVADVHTHPADRVEQSNSDQAHPMIPERGHLALIVPRFAQTTSWTLRAVGQHEYLGGSRWKSPADMGRVRLTLL